MLQGPVQAGRHPLHKYSREQAGGWRHQTLAERASCGEVWGQLRAVTMHIMRIPDNALEKSSVAPSLPCRALPLCRGSPPSGSDRERSPNETEIRSE